MKSFYCISLTIGALFFSGCAKIQRSDDLCVGSSIEHRLNKTVQWNKGCPVDVEVECHIQQLLCQELTPDSAVQIALLNNPHIQAIFEEIGISQADLVEAGLFSNPIFDLVIRYPTKKKFVPDIEYSIVASFIDLFLIPLRVKVAEAELEKTILSVTNEVLDLAFEVEQTFYELQASLQELKYTGSIVELTSIHSELVSRQREVDNVNNLDFQQIQSRFLEAKLEIARVENEIIRLKEKLNRLLGFCGEIHWNISIELPEIDYQGLPIDRLECVAFRERLDLQAARFEVLRLSRKLGIKQWWVYTNGRIGIGGERDSDGLNTLGPAFSGEIPIFNYGQAARLRLRAELRQSQDELASLEIRILSEVREAHKLLMNNLEVINEYRSKIIPLQSKILESSEELYNVMGLGIDRLLENKRQELQAYSNYILSLRNYWMARVQLDRALGGKLYKIFSYDNEPMPWVCQEEAIE
jgi:cobalt-zinc-cadmium efflux system outer membrane protein